MRKGLLTALLTLSVTSVSASEFMEFGAKNFKSTKMKESKWVFDVGANYMAYPTTLPGFKGTHANIEENSDHDIYGINLGFGGELYFGAGLSSTIKIGGFYSKTMNETTGKAAKDVDIDLAEKSTDHMVSGGEASISLNYLFETKSYGIQPFAEFGLGAGTAQVEQRYSYEGLEGGTNPNPESYDVKVEEGFSYARSTVGLNVISATGILFFTKVSRLGMVVNKREVKGTIKTAAKSSEQDVSSKKTDINESNEVFMATLGMGFLF